MIYFLVIAFFGAITFALSALGGDGDADLGMGDGPGLFSLKTISSFMLGLGITGAAVTIGFGLEFQLLSLGLGLLGGVGVSALTYRIYKFVYSQEGNTLLDLNDMVGREANVSIAIPSNGVGQVSCEWDGNRIYEEARSKDNGPVGVGELVYITKIENGVAIVERSDILDTELERLEN